jgi:hypothetical protein
MFSPVLAEQPFELLGDRKLATICGMELEALDLQQLSTLAVQLQQRLRTRDA